MFFCVYCGAEKPDDERSVEHPMSQTIGGSGWSTTAVCCPCNQHAGREVDKPFASDFVIRLHRHRHGIPDSRGEIPPAPGLVGTTERGHKTVATFGRDKVDVKRRPRRVAADDSREEWIVEPGEGDEFLRRRVERLTKQVGPEYEVTGRVDVIADQGTASVIASTTTTLWPRFGAKVALGLGATALGEAWARSDWAAWLRDVLWDRDTAAPDGATHMPPLFTRPEGPDVFSLVTTPPDHTAIFFATATRTILLLQLFGAELRYAVPLGPPDQRCDAAWVFSARTGKACVTTYTDLIAENRARYVEAWDQIASG